MWLEAFCSIVDKLMSHMQHKAVHSGSFPAQRVFSMGFAVRRGGRSPEAQKKQPLEAPSVIHLPVRLMEVGPSSFEVLAPAAIQSPFLGSLLHPVKPNLRVQ